MRILLDTNVYSALLRGHPQVAERVRSAERILISSIVAGELLYGFRHGTRYAENRTQFESCRASRFGDLRPVTLTTADRFGIIAASLRRRAKPIPSNDIWIAAHALETGADLLSFDAHFSAVDGLSFMPMPSDNA
jgi:predicted nucleic acid-binding protein